MKLRALCDAQLSAKSTITNLLCSAKSHKNSKGLEDSSMPGACSMGDSKAEIPGLQKHTGTAKGPDNQAMAEEPKAVTDFMQNSTFSSVKNSTPASAPPTAAESHAAAQKQQLSAFAKTCSKTDSSAVTKALQNPGMDLAMVLKQHLGALGKLKRTRKNANSSLPLFCFTVTTATPDKKIVKYSANTFTPRFSTTTTTTALNQLVWPSLSFPPLPVFPNPSNFPQYQKWGKKILKTTIILRSTPVYILRVTACHHYCPIYSCALFPSPPQVAPYNPQHIFQSPYPPLLNYIPVVQPDFPYQQRTLPKLPTNIQDPPTAGDGTLYPFSPSYRFSSTAGGVMRTNPNYSSSGNYINF
uniref:Uncharacterized protein n=1 Tax=Anas zonorhyncha TaxID=75864 RepID=A0A8B9UMP3_9AVES